MKWVPMMERDFEAFSEWYERMRRSPRSNITHAPSARVQAILRRLSREHYIPPQAVHSIANALVAKVALAQPYRVLKAAVHPAAFEVGMYEGRPLVFLDDPKYRVIRRAVQDMRPRRKEPPESALLRAMLTHLNG